MKATIITIIATNKKQLLKSYIYRVNHIYISFVLEIISMLLNCLLLFNNLREFINNTLYSWKLTKFIKIIL